MRDGTDERSVIIRRLSLLIALVVLVATLGFAAPPASAAPRTVTIFNATLTHRADAYWTPIHSGPSNLVSPYNYTAGNATLRLDVQSKPSSKRLLVQVCMWRSNYTKETCSPTFPIVDEGVYTVNLGRPSGWWKKNGSWSWTTAYSVTRIMLKDPATGRLMNSRHCGSHCYTGGDLNQHVPIRMAGRLTFATTG